MLFRSTDPVSPGGHLSYSEKQYSYGKRLFDLEGTNQIKWVIEKLKRKPETKSATVSLLIPKHDTKEGAHVPCIVTLDFKKREGALNMVTFIRSQDFSKKTYGDLIALGEIQEKVSRAIGTKVGWHNILISSAHIYSPDLNDIKEVIRWTESNL